MQVRISTLAALQAHLLTDITGPSSLKALLGYTNSDPRIGRPFPADQAKDPYLAIEVIAVPPFPGVPALFTAMIVVTAFARTDIAAIRIADRVHSLVNGDVAGDDRWVYDFSNSAIGVKSTSRPSRGKVKYVEELKFHQDSVGFSAVVNLLGPCSS